MVQAKVEAPDNLGTAVGPFKPELLTEPGLATTIVPAGDSVAALGAGDAAGDEVVDDGSDDEARDA